MNKSSKVHATMTSSQFRSLRECMRFSLVDLSVVTKIPYRTLQDYEYGKRNIPARIADLLRREYKLEMKIMAKVLRGIDQRIDAEFPDGIQSEPEGE